MRKGRSYNLKADGTSALRRFAISFPLILLVVYALVMAFAFSFADSLIFQPQTSSYADDGSIVRLETHGGETIAARHLPNETARYTILFSHGNAEDLGTSAEFLEELRRAGFGVFSYDYRGYGTSEGSPSEANAYADLETAYDHLTGKLGVPSERIIIHGRSLGGAVSVDLASRRECGGLIVESSFVSAFRVVTGYRLLPFDKFDSLGKIGRVRCPVLFIHGEEDSLIPLWHSEKLFEAAPEPKSLVRIPGANHNDVFQIQRETYLRAIREFSERTDGSAGSSL